VSVPLASPPLAPVGSAIPVERAGVAPALGPHALARLATRALWDELALHPKPGLVSLQDAGAHSDMDASTFVRSLFSLREHFRALAAAGAAAAPLSVLRELGVRAEVAMLSATGGVNTHRGAIFALGLLGATAALAAARGEDLTDAVLRTTLITTWGAALQAPVPSATPESHGLNVARRFGVRGARGEAAAAFAGVFEIGLPALRAARRRGLDPRRARLAALFALLAKVVDTNVLYRGGRAGLDHMRAAVRDFQATGGVDAGDAIARAERMHRDFVMRGLSPGGCADLLAASLFVDAIQSG
jgi:triphosphoribosyl-dephospho-CoA synthase